MRIFTNGLLLTPDSDPGLPLAETPLSSAPPTGEADATTAAPETAPETPEPKNPADDTARKNNAPKAGLGQRLRRITAATGDFLKAGFTKGKGRPKKCRSCDGEGCGECNFTGVVPGIGDQPNGEPEKSELDETNPDEIRKIVVENAPATDSDGRAIFDEALESGAAVGLDLLDTATGFALDYAGHSPDFTERAIERARARADKNVARFCTALKLWFKEDNIVIEKPGKKAALLNGAALAMPYLLLLKEARAEAARRRLQQSKK